VLLVSYRYCLERYRKLQQKQTQLPEAKLQKSIDETSKDRMVAHVLNNKHKDMNEPKEDSSSSVHMAVPNTIANPNTKISMEVNEPKPVTVKASEPAAINPIEQPLDKLPEEGEEFSQSDKGGAKQQENAGVFKKKRSKKKN